MAAALLPACAADQAVARAPGLQPCVPGSPEVKRAVQGPLERLEITTARGPVRLQVEIADTEGERSQGLMCRRVMAPDQGMLFDFKAEKPVFFWMKNTILPLDMIFVAADGRIVAVVPNTIPFSVDPVGPGVPVQAVLELKAGRAAALGIAPGDRLKHRIFARR